MVDTWSMKEYNDLKQRLMNIEMKNLIYLGDEKALDVRSILLVNTNTEDN